MLSLLKTIKVVLSLTSTFKGVRLMAFQACEALLLALAVWLATFVGGGDSAVAAAVAAFVCAVGFFLATVAAASNLAGCLGAAGLAAAVSQMVVGTTGSFAFYLAVAALLVTFNTAFVSILIRCFDRPTSGSIKGYVWAVILATGIVMALACLLWTPYLVLTVMVACAAVVIGLSIEAWLCQPSAVAKPPVETNPGVPPSPPESRDKLN